MSVDLGMYFEHSMRQPVCVEFRAFGGMELGLRTFG
jgi:hypothetical protein